MAFLYIHQILHRDEIIIKFYNLKPSINFLKLFTMKMNMKFFLLFSFFFSIAFLRLFLCTCVLTIMQCHLHKLPFCCIMRKRFVRPRVQMNMWREIHSLCHPPKASTFPPTTCVVNFILNPRKHYISYCIDWAVRFIYSPIITHINYIYKQYHY